MASIIYIAIQLSFSWPAQTSKSTDQIQFYLLPGLGGTSFMKYFQMLDLKIPPRWRYVTWTTKLATRGIWSRHFLGWPKKCPLCLWRCIMGRDLLGLLHNGSQVILCLMSCKIRQCLVEAEPWEVGQKLLELMKRVLLVFCLGFQILKIEHNFFILEDWTNHTLQEHQWKFMMKTLIHGMFTGNFH